MFGKTRYNEPNELTRNAIEEAMSGQSAGTLDMSSFEAFMESVNEFEWRLKSVINYLKVYLEASKYLWLLDIIS